MTRNETTAARPVGAGDGGERVRHVKRGTEYEVLGEAEAQVSVDELLRRWDTGISRRLINDGDTLTVYRCATTGKLWCRFTDEFRDGRFETIAASSPTDAQPKSGRPVGGEALREALAVIAFAQTIDDHYDVREFLKGWSEGDVSEWPEFLETLSAHPTNGQETVATPRDGGVRGALRQPHKRQLGPNPFNKATSLEQQMLQLVSNYRQGYSDCFSYDILVAWTEDVLSALATPPPAQEPCTGDSGEREKGREEGFLAGTQAGMAAVKPLADKLSDALGAVVGCLQGLQQTIARPSDAIDTVNKALGIAGAAFTPATTAETRGPAEGAR